MARQKRFADSSPESENPALQTDDTQCKKKKKKMLREREKGALLWLRLRGVFVHSLTSSRHRSLSIRPLPVAPWVRVSARYSLHQYERPARTRRLLGPWMDHGKR